MKIIEQKKLAPFTSWRIGGTARYYAEPRSTSELQAALAWGHERELPIFVLGGGTNLLIREQEFAGLVVHSLDRAWHITDQGERAWLSVAAGAPMAGTVRRVSNQGWGGLQWAEGLPGTIGGAIFGNAGCYGGDIASVLERAWLLVENEEQVWSVEQFHFGYRTSYLKQARKTPVTAPGTFPLVVVGAEMRLERADPAVLAAQMADIAAARKSKTPWGRSCGSVFKNPPATAEHAALSAGQLIDQAGLKGTRIGGAEISQRHANYIVNLGDATSDDILRLIDVARTSVQREFGVELELEVQVL